MAKKKSARFNPSSKASANASARLGQAKHSAIDFVGGILMDVQEVAKECIDELLVQMNVVYSSLSMGNSECISEHQLPAEALRHTGYCLRLTGCMATIAAEAFDKCNNPMFEKYWQDIGLELEFQNCRRVIQDAIAVEMIQHPESFEMVMDMNTTLDTRSKLRHAYFIMKRYLRDVGQHLLNMGQPPENLLDRKAASKPAHSSTEPEHAQGMLAGSSTDGLHAVRTAPPGLEVQDTVPVQDLLEGPLAELPSVLDNVIAAGPRMEVDSIYIGILEYVRHHDPSAKQMQILLLQVLQWEPWYEDMSGYSRWISCLGHLLAGTAVVERGQWAKKTGLFVEDPMESVLSRAIRMMVRAGGWHRHHWHQAGSVDFLRKVLVALNRIFEGA
jgi:hypothetical protein